MGCSSSQPVSVKQPRQSTTSTQRRTSSTEFREEKIYALLNRQILGQTTSLDDEAEHHRENIYEMEGTTNMPHRCHSTKVHTYQKCRNVYAAPLQNVEDFVPPIFPKSDEEVKFLKKACSENFIFSGLTTEEKMLIINAMYPQTFESDTVIIQQGDIGDYFYVVEKGRVQFFVNNKLVREGSDGVSFGELALLHNAPRSATVVSLTECLTYRVDQHTFRTLLANNHVQRGKRCVELLKRVSIFKGFDTKVLIKIASAMTEIVVRDEQYIIHKGDIGKIFYIIQEGNVKITDMGLSNETTTSIVQVLKPGDFFGERALITGETRSANAIAVGDCTLLCISKETVEAVVGSLEDLINDTCNKRILMCQSIFANAHLQPSEWDLLSNKMVKVTQSKGCILLEEGKPISNEQKGLYLIRKGEITVSSTNGDEYQQYWRGDSFGEDLIFSDSSMVSSSTAIVDDDVTYYFLSQEDIFAALGGIGRVQPPSLRKYSMDVDITLNQLDKIKILGSGTYGQVWLATDKRTKAAYALKILDKRDIIQRSLEENVVRERKLMGSLNHPFIIKLMNSFQDKKKLFMVMEFVQGGELFDVLHKKNSHGITECSARFYAANIYDGLMHLHERQILYRDLKPENILIDKDGYCILIDLGFAKIVADKTYTLCGTPLYLAPEVVLSRGYDKAVDNWSFGIIVFEMMVGYSPFYTVNVDQKTVFKRVIEGTYRFPRRCKASDEVRDLVSKILVGNPSRRLGSLVGGDGDIRFHPWLASLAQSQMISKQLQPPWKPTIKSSLDTSNFDSYPHLKDKQGLERETLTQSQQALFSKF